MSSIGKKALILSAAMLFLAAFALMAWAHEGMEGMKGGEGMHGKMAGHEMHMAKDLNLTTEQMDKVKSYDTAGEKVAIQDEADMKKLHVDLWAEAVKDNPDLGKIEKLAKETGDLHGKMVLAMVKDKIFFRSLLTHEKKKKLDQMKMDKGGEMGKGHKLGMPEHGK